MKQKYPIFLHHPTPESIFPFFDFRFITQSSLINGRKLNKKRRIQFSFFFFSTSHDSSPSKLHLENENRDIARYHRIQIRLFLLLIIGITRRNAGIRLSAVYRDISVV